MFTPATRTNHRELARTCKRCGSANIERVRNIISNGASQVYDLCLDCNRNANGSGIYLPHGAVGDVTVYRIINDYTIGREPCARCGSKNGTEYHHFAPHHVFGDPEAERWPGAYLCVTCHRIWHDTIAVHYATCELCRKLYKAPVNNVRELEY